MTDVIRIDLANVPLYHGGARTIGPGELILPPIHTRQPAGARPDQVYLTLDLDLARFHAAMYAGRSAGGRTLVGRGAVYEAMPLDTALEPDEQDPPGYTVMVAAARVVRVVEKHVRWEEPGVTPQALAAHVIQRGGLTLEERRGLGRRTTALGRT